MDIVRKAAAVLAPLILFSACATAQNTISVTTNLSRAGSPVPQACRQQAAALESLITLFPRPQQWRWVVICDDAGWQRFLERGDRSHLEAFDADSTENIYASTDIAGHLTCLRGTTLLAPDSPRAQPEHVVAHELAHIFLRTEDEGRAERQAERWMSDRRRTVPAHIEGQ